MCDIGRTYKLVVWCLLALAVPMVMFADTVRADEQSARALVQSVTTEVLDTLRREGVDIRKDRARRVALWSRVWCPISTSG
jgi:ketopantoate reductase